MLYVGRHLEVIAIINHPQNGNEAIGMTMEGTVFSDKDNNCFSLSDISRKQDVEVCGFV
jgi:hypothetical protein